MEQVKSYRNLIVWQKSIEVCTLIYRLTQDFPEDEIFGITSQLRKAAISVPTNISEGHSSNTKKEFRHFVGLASGSLTEVETLMLLTKNLQFTTENKITEISALCTEIGKMLTSLYRKLQSSS